MELAALPSFVVWVVAGSARRALGILVVAFISIPAFLSLVLVAAYFWRETWILSESGVRFSLLESLGWKHIVNWSISELPRHPGFHVLAIQRRGETTPRSIVLECGADIEAIASQLGAHVLGA